MHDYSIKVWKEGDLVLELFHMMLRTMVPRCIVF